MKKLSSFVVLALVAGLVALVASPASAATCNVPTPMYPTIQSAVNDPNCDLIQVAPGTYPENVTINRALTLNGSGETATFVDPPANGPAILISASDVTVSNLTTTGAGGTGNTGAGVRLTGSISNITFESMASTLNGGHGIAIDSTGTMSDLLFDDVNVSDNGGVGIRVPTSLVSLDGLTITGSNVDRNATIGLEISIAFSSSAQTVSDVLVEDTTFNGNLNKGIYAERLDNATFSGLSVVGNGVLGGALFDAGIDINLKFRNYQNISILDSVITDNGAGDPLNGVGLTIKARDEVHPQYGVLPATLTNVTVEGNEIKRNTRDGIRLGEPMRNNPGPTNVHINFNNIEANTQYGVDNQTQTVADAECNWWGSPSGPTAASNPGGTGDEVTENVDYRPWLVAPAPGGACTGPAILPPSADACRNDGWRNYTDDEARPFKNQGDCVSYVETDGRNKADG